jgi:hypothetical protein
MMRRTLVIYRTPRWRRRGEARKLERIADNWWRPMSFFEAHLLRAWATDIRAGIL